MTVLRTDIERALDELASQEEGMRFQGLAVVLGKKVWPELIARQRKKDHGLDAYAPASLTPEKIGKGLAASITPTLAKVAGDAESAKKHFSDLKALLFATPAKVGNADRKRWEEAIRNDYDIELHLIEREEIITQMLMPENAALCASFLNLQVDVEPPIAELVERAERASETVVEAWAERTKGRPLLELTAMRIEEDGQESAEMLSLEQIDQALSASRRIVLEGPAGRGKTTTLIQLASRERTAGLPLLVELPAWISSQRGLLEFVADMPAFQAERLSPADLANVQQSEPFLILLNGWNELAESSSAQATAALRELERDFPEAGIIVATRTHHLRPPLPGALRLRLLRLQRAQRSSYLDSRLGGNAAELRARIEADSSLDDLTRTPLILAEVVSLFEAGAEIPSSKIGVLAEVIRLHEQRDEHRNALQSSPVFDRQTDFLKPLATEMTKRGSVSLQEPDARSEVVAALRHLVGLGQIESVGAPAVLATLAAHHVLERIDYPSTAFQFEHQQIQEYFAALGVQAQLFDLEDDDSDSVGRFTSDYVNEPVWAEPLRMIAETLSVQTGDDETDARNVQAGKRLIEMALAVDPIFAGELAGLCGPAVWDEVRDTVAERFRAMYADDDYGYKPYATAAMMASGQEDFSDIIEPLLSSEDQQVRLRTHRLWPNTRTSILGPDWREKVSSWSEEARSDFVSELLHHGFDTEIAAFAAEDGSMAVKKEAASSLLWAGSEDALAVVLESMDERTFGDTVRMYLDSVPTVLRARAIASVREFVNTTENDAARLRTALDLIEIGEGGLDDIVKDSLAALPSGDMRNMGLHYIRPALEHLRNTDPAWMSEWVAVQVAEGALYSHEYWLPLAHRIPDSVVAACLQRLETEDLGHRSVDGVIAIVASCANADMAARIFSCLRELRQQIDANPGEQHKLERQLMRQMETAFRVLPGDVAAAGILQSVQTGDVLDISVSSNLLSAVARPDIEALQIGDDDLRERLRAYLKSGLDVVIQQDDFNGEDKANLSSALARVGNPEDMEDLVTLIQADIDRVRSGREARAEGDLGPRGNGATRTNSRWHIKAITQLDSTRAEQVLIDLLPEPEFYRDVAAAMARQFLPKSERTFGRAFRHDLLWAARAGAALRIGDEQRRTRFAAALNAEITRLRDQGEEESIAGRVKELAKALAAIDGKGSAEVVLETLGISGEWDQYTFLDAMELLLLAGVVLPADAVGALVESVVQRASRWMQQGDRYLLRRVLALCPFVDDPVAGVAHIREVLQGLPLHGHEMDELLTALGESRSDAAVDFLCELASDEATFERVGNQIIDALAKLDTPRSRDVLLGFVDPDVREVTGLRPPRRDDRLVAHLAELSQRLPEVAARLQELCSHELPDFNRHLISRVMASVSTPESLSANLVLVDDARSPPIPQGVRDQIEGTIVERRPYGQSENVFTQHARAANESRSQLFRMTSEDQKRRTSAHRLLALIEGLRIDYGRPSDEPRHPDLSSGKPWPDIES